MCICFEVLSCKQVEIHYVGVYLPLLFTLYRFKKFFYTYVSILFIITVHMNVLLKVICKQITIPVFVVSR